MSDASPSTGALEGVRVLDLSGERAIYGVKLLADLGADVVRPEPPGGDPLRRRGPFLADRPGPERSLWHAFFASNRRFATLDPGSEAGHARLRRLARWADVVVDGGVLLRAGITARELVAEKPALVVVSVSSFGPQGPWKDWLAPDLVASALGGICATTGDVDTPPLKGFGELAFQVSGVYAAIAALSALRHARATGEGQVVDAYAHDAIASCLEHVLMWVWYHERLPMALGPVLPRRGSLHWTNAYQVVPARKGSIMVTPAPSAEAQIAWLAEEGAHQDLLDPKWEQPENRVGMLARILDVMRGWVAEKEAEELFFSAQARHAPYGQVLRIEQVAENPQLEARSWWETYELGGTAVRGPGAPYRLETTPCRKPRPQRGPGADTEEVLAEIAATGPDRDLEDRFSRSQRGQPETGRHSTRPLEGVRVLDFTHVLAGPFATRVLGDLGADVVKVGSATRPAAGSGAYYMMWNRNKRSLALDMSNPEAIALCRLMCERADVVIDNFSVGVLDRWGVGYDQVADANPGVIYLAMSGMGQDGPWARFVTYAPTIHALAGLTELTGVPGREDIGIGFSLNDHQSGLHGAIAILAGLEARRRTGRGQRIDLSQFEVGVNLLGPALLDLFANGRAARPVGNRLPWDVAAPHDCYPCAGEDRWVAIAVLTDAQWRAFRGVLGEPEWARDPRFDSAAGRVADLEKLDARVCAWTRGLDAEQVEARCQAAGVPAGVVQTGVDLAERDPQLRLHGFMQRLEDHPSYGPVWADRLPLRFRGTAALVYRRPRVIGEDNAAVLAEWLGMSADEVRRREEDGTLR